jgi:nucleotide-binding universal stress UspA family protein
MQVEKMITMMEEDAEKETRATEVELKKSGFDVRVRIEKGIPFRDILRIEEEEEVSVIVVGSHGKGVVKEMLLGSVSEKVIRKSKKPVLVIKG